MKGSQGFAPFDFSDNVEADVTDIRALVVRALWERISYRKNCCRHIRGIMARACRLDLGFVEVCDEQMKFQKFSFSLSAVCDQRISSLPHLDHRNYLRFRARQLGTANHARTAVATRFALSICHDYNVLSHFFALFVSSIFVPIVERGSNVVPNMICCLPLARPKRFQNRNAEVPHLRLSSLTRYSLECMHRDLGRWTAQNVA
jgi:hypothetical protein